jgi:hypothetical protein
MDLQAWCECVSSQMIDGALHRCYTEKTKGTRHTMDKHAREKRAFIRVPLRMNTSLRTRDRTIWSSSTLDISMSGLRIASSEAPPPEGTPCEIEIVLAEKPSSVIIDAGGTIVRSEPGTLAVHFTEVDIDSYEHLRLLILNNAEDPDRAEQEVRAHWGIRRPSRR